MLPSQIHVNSTPRPVFDRQPGDRDYLVLMSAFCLQFRLHDHTNLQDGGDRPNEGLHTVIESHSRLLSEELCSGAFYTAAMWLR